jgi:putative Mg2+ transporter-C (MgtC) family protein
MILLLVRLLQLGLATLLGACIGATCHSQKRSAWIEVCALFALGSALLTMVASSSFTLLPGAVQMHRHPTPIIAWIIIGSYLLGAGWLLGQQRRPTSTEWTTALMMGAVAIIGILCGAGWLLEAVGVVILVLGVLLLYSVMKRYLFLH